MRSMQNLLVRDYVLVAIQIGVLLQIFNQSDHKISEECTAYVDFLLFTIKDSRAVREYLSLA